MLENIAIRFDAEIKIAMQRAHAENRKMSHILDCVRIEEWSVHTWLGIGCKPHERSALDNEFVARAELGLPTTRVLIMRLTMDRALKRLLIF
jgi:hypothetical protein